MNYQDGSQNYEQSVHIDVMPDMFHYEPQEPRHRKRRGKHRQYRPNKRVLLVDDSSKAITPLNIIFRNLGCETVLSFDGGSAVEEIALNPPDLIILDWKMPDVSGGEALVRAQKMLLPSGKGNGQRSHPRIPVVTFSAHAFSELKLPPCENFRFVDHWQKPMSMAELGIQAVRLMSLP